MAGSICVPSQHGCPRQVHPRSAEMRLSEDHELKPAWPQRRFHSSAGAKHAVDAPEPHPCISALGRLGPQ